MINKMARVPAFGLLLATAAWCQNAPVNRPPVPIYRVTVVERTVKAVDYRYRSGPTPIDFRGTVLLPKAKGDAMVESKAGRTEIDARFDHLEAPTRYGNEYLTYVLWAITPEGHAKNLGEIIPGSSDHARMHVTTDLLSFGMLVTAEPYSAVRQPSDVVVMENEVRPETVGGIEQIQARYELLPRGEYTYNVPSDLQNAAAQGEKLSMDRYEALLEVYQAQNAVQIARSMGADQYAPDVFNKAEALYRTAQEAQMRHADRNTVVTAARQAAQTAEDSRAIAEKRQKDEQLSQAQAQVAKEQELRMHEQELRAKAEADLQAARNEARNQASADRVQKEEEERSSRARLEAERARLETETAALQAPPPPPPTQTMPAQTYVQTAPSQSNLDYSKTEFRQQLYRELKSAGSTMDTPRGLVVTLPDADFRGASLNPSMYSSLQRIASIVRSHPGLYVSVEGHTDNAMGESRAETFSYERASAVRAELARAGVPASALSARGLGNARPLASNATAAGREQNRRVEITIYGDPVGTLPVWDKTYSLAPQR
ncbi:MAG TPA: OmpA family protein [Bryobacteraceae bacterium]|nr:OmpA family protein [Bryobacteraceae bacterium]